MDKPRDIVTDCIIDLETKLKSVSMLHNKIFNVTNENDLLESTRIIIYPAAGVIYEGMISNQSAGDKKGLSSTLSLGIYIVLESKSLGRYRDFTRTSELLTLIRNAIRETKSPSGHDWVFVSEMFAGEEKGSLTYSQRWATKVILTN